jgi:LPXTG-motif cell wall-anchored protein
MRRLVACLTGLLMLLPGPAGATVLMELDAGQGELLAHLAITGDTLLVDDQGLPRLTAADQLLCTLAVTAPAAMDVQLPEFSGAGFGDFTLLDQGEATVKRTAAGLVHQRQWLVEPYNPGPYQLPELVIRGRQAALTTELILPRPEVVAQAITGSEAELDDILPPQLPAPSPLGPLAGAAALALLAGAAWFVARRKKKGPSPLPPKTRALAEMALLSDLPAREQIHRLAFILRCYLASRFELRCLEQTYDEYRPALAACAEIPQASRDIFLAVLARCDLIKFSKIEAAPAEAEEIASQIKAGLAACPLATPEDRTCGRW